MGPHAQISFLLYHQRDLPRPACGLQTAAEPSQGGHSMKRYGLIGAIALIVLTNVVVLAGVVYNRSGEPDAVVQLTERELSWLKRWDVTDKEDTGIYLKLKWNLAKSHYRQYRTNHWTYQKGDSWLNQ